MTEEKVSEGIALVTGGNKGIGLATVRALGMKGYTVFLAARDKEKGHASIRHLIDQKLDIRVLELDVTNEEEIFRARDQIQEEAGQLNLLINNAGISTNKEDPRSLKSFKEVFETNVFGLYAVTKAMLPLLILGKPARIINLSSGFGSLANLEEKASRQKRPGLLFYSCSKAAVNAITINLAAELKDQGMTVLSFAPESTSTDSNEHKGKNTPEQTAAFIVDYALRQSEGLNGGFFDEKGRLPW